MKKEFIYKGYAVTITPNGEYFTAMAVNENGEFKGAFANSIEKVEKQIRLRIDGFDQMEVFKMTK